MAIPPTVYAPSHTYAQHTPLKGPPPIIGTQSKSPSPPYAPPTGHMPIIGTQSKSPSPQPSSPRPYEPQIYREPLTCLTREMLYDHIYLVLRDTLTDWWAENPDAMHRLVYYLSDYVIKLGMAGIFGPNGMQSLWQLCMFIGHESKRCYMCLAVQPERGRTGGPTIVLQGKLCEKEGNDPLVDEEVFGLAKDGFEKAAQEMHAIILAKSPGT
ncbi:hypothetical protein BKA58DRAFT_310125 [Alternaria rosae]|uniref:uncharacterized protein n=1 Tax=Alternaria rosae TaxID=1187941 RepID=UPI001E8EEDCE|nr:uncharacterized protein BKA58DRAFT_310125 [Alternaria rosae]KAH6876184.1 hypothetical protein BKA58DRAFT_310125 [Alternaria rosae]